MEAEEEPVVSQISEDEIKDEIDDKISISSDDICEVDCVMEAEDISSDEEQSKNEKLNESNEVLRADERIPWRVDDLILEGKSIFPTKWSSISKEETIDENSLELLQGALEDLGPEAEFTPDDWDATLSEIIDRSFHSISQKFLDKDGVDRENFLKILKSWLRYGLTQRNTEKTEDSKEKSQKENEKNQIRHWNVGLKLFRLLSSHPDSEIRNLTLNPETLHLILDILLEQKILKSRSEAAETFFTFLCESTKDNELSIEIFTQQEPSPSVLDRLILFIVSLTKSETIEEKNKNELMKIANLSIVLIDTILLLISRRKLWLLCASDDDPNDEKSSEMLKIFGDFSTKFFSLIDATSECYLDFRKLYLFVQNGFVERLSKMLLLLPEIPYLACAAQDFLEKLFNEPQGFLILYNVEAEKLSVFLEILQIYGKQTKLDDPNDGNSKFVEYSVERVSENFDSLHQRISVSFRAIQLVEQFLQTSSEIGNDLETLKDSKILEPLREIVSLMKQDVSFEKPIADICSIYAKDFYAVIEMANAEKDETNRGKLLTSSYARSCFEVFEKIFTRSLCPSIWSQYADKLLAFSRQHKNGIPASLIQWVRPLADPILRSIRHGSRSCISQMKKVLSTFNGTTITPQVLQYLRLILASVTENTRVSNVSCRKATISLVTKNFLDTIKRIFKRITNTQVDSWRSGVLIESPDAFLFREAATACLQIFRVCGRKLEDSYLVSPLLEVLAITGGINQQKNSKEGDALRETVIGTILAFVRVNPIESTKKFVTWINAETRAFLYSSVYLILWTLSRRAMIDENVKAGLETVENWDRFIQMLFSPSTYSVQMVSSVLKSFFILDDNLSSKIIGSFLDKLDDLTAEKTVVESTGITAISDDEDQEKTSADSWLITDGSIQYKPLSTCSAQLEFVVKLIRKLLDEIPNLETLMAHLIGSTRARSRTWRFASRLAFNGQRVDECQENYKKNILEICLKFCGVKFEETGKEKEESIEPNVAKIDTEEADDEIKLDYRDDTIEHEVETETIVEDETETVKIPSSILQLFTATICEWNDLELNSICERLDLLTKLVCFGETQANEVCRQLLVNLNVLLSRLDTEFSPEPPCITIIDQLFTLLESLEGKTPKALIRVIIAVERNLLSLCELVEGSSNPSIQAGDKAAHFRILAAKTGDQNLEIRQSFVDADALEKASKSLKNLSKENRLTVDLSLVNSEELKVLEKEEQIPEKAPEDSAKRILPAEETGWNPKRKRRY